MLILTLSLLATGLAEVHIQLNHMSPKILQFFDHRLDVSASFSRGSLLDGTPLTWNAQLGRFTTPIVFEWSIEPPLGTDIIVTGDTSEAYVSFSKAGIYNIICTTNSTNEVADASNQAPRQSAFLQIAYVGFFEDVSCESGTSDDSSGKEAELLAFAAEALSRYPSIVDALALSSRDVPRTVDTLHILNERYKRRAPALDVGGLATISLEEFLEHNVPIVDATIYDADGIVIASSPLPEKLWFPNIATDIGANPYWMGEVHHQHGTVLQHISRRIEVAGMPAFLRLGVRRIIPQALIRWLPQYGFLARPFSGLPVGSIRPASSWNDIMRHMAPLMGEWVGGRRVARSFVRIVTERQASEMGMAATDAAKTLALAAANAWRDSQMRTRWKALGGVEVVNGQEYTDVYLDSGCEGSPTGFCLVEAVEIGLTAAEVALAATQYKTITARLQTGTVDNSTFELLHPGTACATCAYGAVWHVQVPISISDADGLVLRDSSKEAFDVADRFVRAESESAALITPPTVTPAGGTGRRREGTAAAVESQAAYLRHFAVDPRPVGVHDTNATGRDRVASAASSARGRAATAALALTLPDGTATYVLKHVSYERTRIALRLLHCPHPMVLTYHLVEHITTLSTVPEASLFVNLDPRDSSGAHAAVAADCHGDLCAYRSHAPLVASEVFADDVVGQTPITAKNALLDLSRRYRLFLDGDTVFGVDTDHATQTPNTQRACTAADGSKRQCMSVFDEVATVVDEMRGSGTGQQQTVNGSVPMSAPASLQVLAEAENGYTYAAVYRTGEAVTLQSPGVMLDASPAALSHIIQMHVVDHMALFPTFVAALRATPYVADRSEAQLVAATEAARARAQGLQNGTVVSTALIDGLLSVIDGESKHTSFAYSRLYDTDGILLASYPPIGNTPRLGKDVVKEVLRGSGIHVGPGTDADVSIARARQASHDLAVVLIDVVVRAQFVAGGLARLVPANASHGPGMLLVRLGFQMTVKGTMSILSVSTGRTVQITPGTPMDLPAGRYRVTETVSFDHVQFASGSLLARVATNSFSIAVVRCDSGTLNLHGDCVTVTIWGYIVAALGVVVIIAVIAVILQMYRKYRNLRRKYDALPRPAVTDKDRDEHAARHSLHEDAAAVAVVPLGETVKDTPFPSGCYCLFSDIEGSTQLWSEYTSVMEQAVTVHHEVIRARCARHNGIEVNSQGDSFFFVFHNATDCLEAAVMIQIDLLQAQWSRRLLKVPLCSPSVETCADTSSDARTAPPLSQVMSQAPTSVKGATRIRQAAKAITIAADTSSGAAVVPPSAGLGGNSEGMVPPIRLDTLSANRTSPYGSPVETSAANPRKFTDTVSYAMSPVGLHTTTSFQTQNTMDTPRSVAAAGAELLTLMVASNNTNTEYLPSRSPSQYVLEQDSGASTRTNRFGSNHVPLAGATGDPTRPLRPAASLPADVSAPFGPYAGNARSDATIDGLVTDAQSAPGTRVCDTRNGWPNAGAPLIESVGVPRNPSGDSEMTATAPVPSNSQTVHAANGKPARPLPLQQDLVALSQSSTDTGIGLLATNANGMRRTTNPHNSRASENSGTSGSQRVRPGEKRTHKASTQRESSVIPSTESTLANYSIPPFAWRGLRVRIGCAPLENARLHLFGLQSFRQYLMTCGSGKGASALEFDYLGPDVNRAARIANIPRGGEVIVEENMLALVDPVKRAGLSIVKMGSMMLKGIGPSGNLASVLPAGLGRAFGSNESAAHCGRCYGSLICPSCEADDNRLLDLVCAID